MHTKKFKSGNSLAIRIPHELASFFQGHSFKIFRKKNQIIIENEPKEWIEIFDACYNPDFPEREKMKFAKREKLWLN